MYTNLKSQLRLHWLRVCGGGLGVAGSSPLLSTSPRRLGVRDSARASRWYARRSSSCDALRGQPRTA
jgi:hypothetical protein